MYEALQISHGVVTITGADMIRTGLFLDGLPDHGIPHLLLSVRQAGKTRPFIVFIRHAAAVRVRDLFPFAHGSHRVRDSLPMASVTFLTRPCQVRLYLVMPSQSWILNQLPQSIISKRDTPPVCVGDPLPYPRRDCRPLR